MRRTTSKADHAAVQAVHGLLPIKRKTPYQSGNTVTDHGTRRLSSFFGVAVFFFFFFNGLIKKRERLKSVSSFG